MGADVKKITEVNIDYGDFKTFLEETTKILKKCISDNFPVGEKPKKGYRFGFNKEFSGHINGLIERINNKEINLVGRLNSTSKQIIKEIIAESKFYLKEANNIEPYESFGDDTTIHLRNKKLVPLTDVNINLDFQKYNVGWDFLSFTLNFKDSRLSKWRFNGFNKGHHYITYKKIEYPILRYEKGKKNIRIYLDNSAMVNGDHSSATKGLKETIKELEYSIPKISIKS